MRSPGKSTRIGMIVETWRRPSGRASSARAQPARTQQQRPVIKTNDFIIQLPHGNELLKAPTRSDVAGVQVSLRVRHDMFEPIELTNLPAAAADLTDFGTIVAIEDMDDAILAVPDV